MSPLVALSLDGPRRRARVLAKLPAAVYLDAGGVCVPVLTAGALLLPTAVRLPPEVRILDLDVHAGDDIRVGEGELLFPGATLEVVRTWRPRRVREGTMPDADALASVVDAAHATRPGDAARPVGTLTARATRATRACDSGSSAELALVLDGLVGLGPGLTPSGDDVLAGLALALVATRGADSRAVRDLRSAFIPRRAATTLLSASLVEAALAGHGTPQVLDLVDALTATARPRRSRLDSLVAGVTGIGHTSGRDLLLGLLAGWDSTVSGGASLRPRDEFSVPPPNERIAS